MFDKHILVIPDCLDPVIRAAECWEVDSNIETIRSFYAGATDFVIERMWFLYCLGSFYKTEKYIFNALSELTETYTYDKFKEVK